MSWLNLIVVLTGFITLVTTLPAHAEQKPAQQSQPYYSVAVEADDIVARTLFNAIAKELDIEIRYDRYADFDSLLKGVMSGESDFAANITHTQERAKLLSYSKPTNIEYSFLYTLDNIPWENIRFIGVPKDTIFKQLIEKNYPHIGVVEYSGFSDAKYKIEHGVIDGAVDAIHLLKPMLQVGLIAELLNDKMSIKPVSLVSKVGAHDELLRHMAEIAHDPKVQKELREAIESYQFTIRQASLRKMVIDSGINTDEAISFKLENLFPFNQYTTAKRPHGISADTIYVACGILALKCNVTSRSSETWSEMYTEFQNGSVDAIAPLTISESRKEFTNFTIPHYFPESILAKRTGYNDRVYRNVSEMIVERIGVVEDDFFDELLQQLLPQKELLRYPSQLELVNALINNEVDYVALDRSKLNHLLLQDRTLNIEEDAILEPFYRSEIAVGFKKSPKGEKLAYLFTHAFRMIDTQQIVDKYDAVPDWRTTLETEKYYANIFQYVLSAIIVFLFIMSWLMLRLAVTDNLTKLKNRRALQIRHKNGLKENEFLLYLDLNKFKQINDEYGHNVGDFVLQQYGSLIKRTTKGRCYRIGGDEFIIVGDIVSDNVQYLVNTFKSFRCDIPEKGFSFEVTASIGVFLSEVKHKSLQDLLLLTDLAMYKAKKSNQQDHVVVDREFVQEVAQENQLHNRAEVYSNALVR